MEDGKSIKAYLPAGDLNVRTKLIIGQELLMQKNLKMKINFTGFGVRKFELQSISAIYADEVNCISEN